MSALTPAEAAALSPEELLVAATHRLDEWIANFRDLIERTGEDAALERFGDYLVLQCVSTPDLVVALTLTCLLRLARSAS
ncbi:MAG TPA: hypothetical protein VL652_34810 [Kutzneria sp.]|jgi:hypothetical protein|nr:hypothetical protein [Kutzneria sp.]